MKTTTSILVLALAMLIINQVWASEADTTKIERKIVKTIQVSDDGKTVVDSTTVYDGDKVEVFVNSGTRKQWMGKMGKGHFAPCPNDVMIWGQQHHEEIDLALEHADGVDSAKVFVFKHKRGNGTSCPLGERYIGPGNKRLDHFRGIPFTQEHRLLMHQREQLIDLNDPDIISFEKSEIKNGQEKIVIIRKKNE